MLRKFARPMVLALVLSLIPFGSSVAAATTRVVDDDGFATATDCDALTPTPYILISLAEADAGTGDTIIVCPGIYLDQVFIDVDDLILLGAQAGIDARTRATLNESVIDHPCGPVQISADNVVLDGFTIQGSTLFDPCFLSGIWTNPGHGGTQGGHQILNNIIQNNISGIELDSTCVNPTLVQFNLIKDNNNPGPGSANAIQTNFGLCNATIDNNKFSGHINSSVRFSAIQSNITISNNELVGGTTEGFTLGNTTTMSIAGNVSVGTLRSATIRLFGGNSDVTINGNTLVDGIRAIWVDNPFALGPNLDVVAHQNCIQDNSVAGMQVDLAGHFGPLDAQNNWWGDPSGPTNPNNPPGTGDAIIDPGEVVVFIPFLTTPPTLPGCPAAPPPPLPTEGKGTGGGQVQGASFGFNAQVKGGVSSGHFQFSEKGGPSHHCDVTQVTFVSATVIEFNVDCNTGEGQVRAEDNQKKGSGAGADKLTFSLSTKGGILTHGQITVHNK